MEILFGIIGVFIGFFVGRVFGAARKEQASQEQAIEFALWIQINGKPGDSSAGDKSTVFFYYDYEWFTLEELFDVYNDSNKHKSNNI